MTNFSEGRAEVKTPAGTAQTQTTLPIPRQDVYVSSMRSDPKHTFALLSGIPDSNRFVNRA